MSNKKPVTIANAECCISLVSGDLAVIPLELYKVFRLSFGVTIIGDVSVVVGCGFRDSLVVVRQVWNGFIVMNTCNNYST